MFSADREAEGSLRDRNPSARKPVEPGAALDGARVCEIEGASPRIRIVALKREADVIQIIPSRDEKVGAHDHLVVIGAREELAEMALQAQAAAP